MSMGTDSKSDLIIEASTRVFPRLGYHNATVEDIIQEASVARSTFYAYFPNKREIFAHIVTGITARILEMIESGVDAVMARFSGPAGSRPPDSELVQALVDLMAEVFRFIEVNRGMTKIFFNDLVGIDDEMTQVFLDFLDRFTGDFERLMRFGVDIEFLRNVNERRAAEFIVGGLIHTARNISAGIGDYDCDEISREIVDMQLNGLCREQVRIGGGR
jgi:AcrR family transcriptional regulator